MVNNIDINSIKPAAYNPRKITDEQKQELCKSIRKFGLIVPILVNRKDNVIIAGHQRTKAARIVGIETVPVQYVDSINLGDEIKFNQIHNATESGTVKVRFDGDAEHLPIDAKYNNPADVHYRTKSYCTCRNWQFANYFETHLKRGA